MLYGGYLESYHKACPEQVFMLGKGKVTFGLDKQSPSMTKGKVVFITYMNTSYELVRIAAGTGSDTQITVIVPASCDTWLLGCSYSPCTVVVPK